MVSTRSATRSAAAAAAVPDGTSNVTSNTPASQTPVPRTPRRTRTQNKSKKATKEGEKSTEAIVIIDDEETSTPPPAIQHVSNNAEEDESVKNRINSAKSADTMSTKQSVQNKKTHESSLQKNPKGEGVEVRAPQEEIQSIEQRENSGPITAKTAPKSAVDESQLAAMDSSNFLRRDQNTSQFCRELIRESYCQQSEVEFGSKLPKYHIAPQRRGKRRPPLGPLVALETGKYFDSDQLWEEIELRNRPLLAHVHRRLGSIKAQEKAQARKKLNEETATVMNNEIESEEDNEQETAVNETKDDDSPEANGEIESDGSSSGEDKSDSTAPSDEGSPKRRVRFAPDTKDLTKEQDAPEETSLQKGPSLEDGFFSIADMEMFADDAEQLALAGKLVESDEDPSDDESSDSDGSDEEGPSAATGGDNPRYADFFDPPEGSKLQNAAEKGHKVAQLLGADDEDIAESEKTPLAASQARTRKMIEAIEEENVKKKPWQLRGEVTGHSRPKDSLLDATMEHDTSGKVAMIVDEDRNETIEDIIRQRIVDRLFDDVVPAFPEDYQTDQGKKRKELPEVSQEKPKESLADVYEQEYLGEKEKARNERRSQEVQRDNQDAENDEQREVNRLYNRLAEKLDALSALHFTPSAPKESTEMTVSASVKAISAEEAIPEGVSDATVLAPKQVYSADTKEIVGEKEKTKTERRAARGRAKTAKRKRNHAKERAAQLMAQANPTQVEKRKAEEALLRRGKKLKVAQTDGFKSKSPMSLSKSPKLGRVGSAPDEPIKLTSAKRSASSLVL